MIYVIIPVPQESANEDVMAPPTNQEARRDEVWATPPSTQHIVDLQCDIHEMYVLIRSKTKSDNKIQ